MKVLGVIEVWVFQFLLFDGEGDVFFFDCLVVCCQVDDFFCDGDGVVCEVFVVMVGECGVDGCCGFVFLVVVEYFFEDGGVQFVDVVVCIVDCIGEVQVLCVQQFGQCVGYFDVEFVYFYECVFEVFWDGVFGEVEVGELGDVF